MGKFNEYTQKATPADNDTMMIYDAAAKANKLSPFSGIWNWIVGKLTNAVISNLQTSNKSVIGALNELNSKAVFTSIHNRVAFKSTTEYSYSGVSITIPKKAFAIFQVKAVYAKSRPVGIIISTSPDTYIDTCNKAESYPAITEYIHVPNNNDTTYYIWTKYLSIADNIIDVSGCQFL